MENHPKDGTPLFVYMALHSVHGPNEDPFPIVDVNETFPEIVDYPRRIFAGMVLALDKAVENITNAYKNAGLWQDTVTVCAYLHQQLQRQRLSLPKCAVLKFIGVRASLYRQRWYRKRQ